MIPLSGKLGCVVWLGAYAALQFLPALLGRGKVSPYHNLAREEHHLPAQSLSALAKVKS